LRFDDPQIGIDWRIADPSDLILSDKDMKAPLLADADINFIY
jgi:dTDP-4-dehydrorhamnose 3,5-epimerase